MYSPTKGMPGDHDGNSGRSFSRTFAQASNSSVALFREAERHETKGATRIMVTPASHQRSGEVAADRPTAFAQARAYTPRYPE